MERFSVGLDRPISLSDWAQKTFKGFWLFGLLEGRFVKVSGVTQPISVTLSAHIDSPRLDGMGWTLPVAEAAAVGAWMADDALSGGGGEDRVKVTLDYDVRRIVPHLNIFSGRPAPKAE